jgi:aspartyl-tRNA(Asn)/glutamyl-tRNA(Gln) amidotransferase subunit A
MTALHELTIKEAGDRLRAGEVSSVDLLEATLRRIEETEPVLHAYAHLLAEPAHRAAEQADREMAQGRIRSPLHGIPLGIKDIIYVKGAPNESGSRALAGFVPDFDATVVERIRSAGGVIVGKTATHEFAYGVNKLPAVNPWKLGYMPGGSSIGSGVAVSARSAFGALGTDTGGSIRFPSAMNGLVGLKPTYGRVGRHGVVSLAWSLDHVGPMTRTVEDCAIMLQAIAGHDPRDPGSVDHPVPDYRAGLESGVEGLVIGVERDYCFYDGVSTDVREAVDAAIGELERLGARIVEVRFPQFKYMTAVGMTIMLSEGSAYHRGLVRQRGADFDRYTRLQVELGELIPSTHYVMAQRARRVLRDAMAGLFREHRLDAMLWPSTPLPSVPYPSVNDPRPDYPSETPSQSYDHNSFDVNVTGQPAMSVPCGFSRDGLPIGFQLVGRPFEEAALLRIARAYEREHDWFTRQPPVPVSA